MKVKDKTIVVTGGGNGIGRELVLNLLEKGAHVAAVDINEKALEETVQLAGDRSGKLSTHVLDITDKKDVEAFPEKLLAKYGEVDGIINNAGIIQPFIKINELDYDAINRVFNVNFWGTMYMTKSFLPHLLKRPEAHVVNVSSMGGFLPVPGQSIYGAAKAAVKLMTEALYAELKDTNVKVTVVFPGAIGTNISVNSGVNIKNSGDAESSKFNPMPPAKAAGIIVAGMEKNKFRVLVGNDSKTMNRLYRFNPKFATGFIARQMKSLLDN